MEPVISGRFLVAVCFFLGQGVSSGGVPGGEVPSESSDSVIYGSLEEIHPATGGQFRSANPSGFVSDWNKDWFQSTGGADGGGGGGGGGVGGGGGGAFGGRVGQGKCVDIPANMTLCRGIGYGQMRLPNLLEHDSVKEAAQQASSWVPLFNLHCHSDTQVFLCSLFAPVCLDRPIWPCKTLCEAVKVGCEARMLKYGFPWPEMLRCDKFPPDNDLCIGMRNDNKPDETVCPACGQPETFENVVDNFCSTEFALRIRLEAAIVSESDLKLVTVKKKKAYKKGSLKTQEMRDSTFYIENGAKCRCQITEELVSDPKNQGGYVLVMGSRKNGKLVLTFMERVDSQSPDMKKALDAIRSEKICNAGIQIITSEEVKPGKGGAKPEERKGNSRKGNGMKGDGVRTNGKAKEGLKDRNKGDGSRRDGKNRGTKQSSDKGNRMKGDGKKGSVEKEDRKQAEGKSREEQKNGKRKENTERNKDSGSKPDDKNGKRKRQKQSLTNPAKSSS